MVSKIFVISYFTINLLIYGIIHLLFYLFYLLV